MGLLAPAPDVIENLGGSLRAWIELWPWSLGAALLSLFLGIWLARMLSSAGRRRTAAKIRERDEALAELRQHIDGAEKAHLAARRELGELQSQWDQTPVALFTLGAARRILATNPTANEMFGRESGELVGRSLSEFLRPKGGEQNVLDGELYCTTTSAGGEVEILHKDGHASPAMLWGRPVLDSKGSPIAEACVAVNLSGVNRSEGVAGEARAATGSNEKPDTSESESLQAAGRLAASIGHDFNNQLTAILGHSDMLGECCGSDGPEAEHVSEIARAASKARQLTDQLLAFGRARVVKPTTIDLVEEFQALEPRLSRLAGSGTSLLLRVEPGLRVHFDPEQFRALACDLVAELSQGMGHGEIVLEARESLPPSNGRDDHSSWVRLEIRGDGPRFAPQLLAESIRELGRTTNPESLGVDGIGMSVAVEHLSGNGGCMSVETEGDHGYLAVYLPGAPKRLQAEPEPPAPRSAEAPIVLVVEDDPQVRHIVRCALESDGLEVIEACDGGDALELHDAHARRLALVITDLEMPRMNGAELGAALQERSPGLPVLYMSGYVEGEAFPEDVGDGSAHLLQKPFAPSALLELVHSILDEASAGEPPAARRVLVVDDEEGVRKMMITLLESLGFACEAAADGGKGLAALANGTFDLVISDMVMPGTDGVEFCAAVRRRFPDVGVIAMSGKSGGRAILEVAEKLGASATLAKPFSKDELLLAIRHVIG